MSNRKRNFASILIILGALLITALFSSCGEDPVMPVDLQLGEASFHPANYKQHASSVDLGVFDGHLYIWNSWEQTLSRFESNAFKSIASIDGNGIGMQKGYFYYVGGIDIWKNPLGNYILCSFNLQTGEHTNLMQVQSAAHRAFFFTEDHLYFPRDLDYTLYEAVQGSQLLNIEEKHEIYVIGENAYVLEGESYHANLVRYSDRGAGDAFIMDVPLGRKSMIPCDNGLLIHNEDNGNFLYFVEADTGKVVELFTTDCIYAISAVNVHGRYAYLSFVRYTELGSLGLAGKKNENDELNGTYRIDLVDYTAEKISNEIYNGLFIFDSTGIYACNDDRQVYKLDFEGNILLKLTE